MARVVVIDDSKPICDLLAVGLRKAGFEVTPALSADAGLIAIARVKPDVILLDLEMPSRDGVWCLRAIRSDPDDRGLPVFMISAHPAREVILRVAQLGVQGIIIKGDNFLREVGERLNKFVSAEPADKAGSPAVVATPRVASVERAGASSDARLAPARPAEGTLVSPVDLPIAPSAVANTVAPPSSEDDQQSLHSSVMQLDLEGPSLERANEELRKIKPLLTRSQMLERIGEGCDLRAVKPVVQQVLSLTGIAGGTVDAVAKAIRQDQALALKVLKVANSPLYARGDRVDSVQKAVSRIGMAQIRSTVMGLSVLDQFGASAFAGRIRAEWFWEHSLACGLIASRLAAACRFDRETADAMFTAGVLHDVGRLIIAERLGEDYQKVVETADRLQLPLESVESRMLLVNHADLSDRLLRVWNFSSELINPIALHHLSMGNIRRMAPRAIRTVACLALANRLAHAMLLGCSGNDAVYPIEEFVDALGIQPSVIADLVRSVPSEAADMKVCMLSHGGDAGTSFIDDLRQRLGRTIRPVVIAERPELSAVGIACSRLAEQTSGSASESPNLAIVRMGHVRERAGFIEKLRGAESKAGVQDLPVLVVGTSPTCSFADGMLSPRQVRQLVVPVRLHHIIVAIGELVRAEEATKA